MLQDILISRYVPGNIAILKAELRALDDSSRLTLQWEDLPQPVSLTNNS